MPKCCTQLHGINGVVMGTSAGEGHHVTVVGSAANNSSALSTTTIHGDARIPMGVASTTVADASRVLTLQRSSCHDAQSSLSRLYEPHLPESYAACAF